MIQMFTYQSFFIWKSFGALGASFPCLCDDVVVILPGVIVVLGVAHEGEGAVVALLSRVILHLHLDRQQQQQQKTKRFSKINFIFMWTFFALTWGTNLISVRFCWFVHFFCFFGSFCSEVEINWSNCWTRVETRIYWFWNLPVLSLLQSTTIRYVHCHHMETTQKINFFQIFCLYFIFLPFLVNLECIYSF